MAFDYLAGSSNLTNLIFSQLLKISSTNIIHYTSIQDQVLYLIFIPHIILFLFLYAFSIGIVARVTGGHVGFSRLLGIAAYIYIIWSGWYGTFLIPLLNAWFVIALFFGLIVFLITAVMHPARGVAIEELGGKLGVIAGKKLSESIKKDKNIEELYRHKEYIEGQVNNYQKRLAASPGNSGLASALSAYEDKLKEVKEQIRKQEGD
jgi:hypothetical protein